MYPYISHATITFMALNKETIQARVNKVKGLRLLHIELAPLSNSNAPKRKIFNRNNCIYHLMAVYSFLIQN